MARQPKRKAQEEAQDDGIEVEVGGEHAAADQGAVAAAGADETAKDQAAAAEGDAGKDQGPTPEEIEAWRKAHEEADDLRKRIDDAERRAQEAAKRAQEADERAHAAGRSTNEAKVAAITNSMEVLNAKIAAGKDSIAKAYEAGDFAAIAEATTTLTKLQAQLIQLEDGKDALAEEAKRPAPKPQPASDLEAKLQGVPVKSADWLRQHPEFVTDDAKARKVLAAHNLAMLNDIAVESDTYFRFIEEQVGLRKAQAAADDEGDDDGEVEVDTQPARTGGKGAARKGAVAAAPVSRGSGGGLRSDGGNTQTRVRLTPGQLATAERLGMTPKKYAENWLKYQARERARGNIR